MTTLELNRKQEFATKMALIESRIQMRVEEVGGSPRPEHKSALVELTGGEVQQLAIALQGVRTASEANTMIVRAIKAADQARR
jgi:hypothetical protein